LTPPPIHLKTIEGNLPHADLPFHGGIKTQKQLDQGGFPASAGPHNGGHLIAGNGQGDLVKDLGRPWPFIPEGDAVQHQVPLCGQGNQLPRVILFLSVLVDFSEPEEADAGVLGRSRKGHELLQRHVELPDDELHRHQHPQGHPAVKDRPGRQIDDQDILGLVQKDRPGLLPLVQHQRMLTHPEQPHLNPLPLPPLPVLTIVQLDLLHTRDQLVEI